jgi:hypothetical protein
MTCVHPPGPGLGPGFGPRTGASIPGAVDDDEPCAVNGCPEPVTVYSTAAVTPASARVPLRITIALCSGHVRELGSGIDAIDWQPRI